MVFNTNFFTILLNIFDIDVCFNDPLIQVNLLHQVPLILVVSVSPCLQLTLSLSGNQDTEILSAVKKTTANTRKLLGDLQHLKTKVYGMEKKVLHVHD